MRTLTLVLLMLVAPLARAGRAPTLREAQITTLEQRLQLDGDTAGRMQSLIDKYNAKIAPLSRADVALLAQLRQQLALTLPDAQRLRSLSSELIKNRAKLQTLRDDRLREMQKLLAPDQLARLFVQWPYVTRELRHEARRAHRR